MTRGRKKKPTSLHLLHGNPSKIKDLEKKAKKEPKPKSSTETASAWIRKDKIAHAEWKRVIKELCILGLFTVIDRTALESYVKAWANYKRAQNVIDLEGTTFEYTNKAGFTNIIARPEVAMAQKWLQICKTYISDFGLSPSARSRMDVHKPDDDDDEMSKLLKMG